MSRNNMGGCGGIVPFTTFEDCESSCNVFNINNNIKSDKEIIFRFDVLGKIKFKLKIY